MFYLLDNHIPNNCRNFLLVFPVENKNNVLYCANKEMRDMVKLVSLQCIALKMRNIDCLILTECLRYFE